MAGYIKVVVNPDIYLKKGLKVDILSAVETAIRL